MAHRGRINVLVNTMGKMPKDLFAEFEGKHDDDLLAGDVKYHQGFSSNVMTPGGPMHVTLAFNPSHLEIVNPVVEGSVRARQHRRGDKHRRPGAAGADPRRRRVRGAGRQHGNVRDGADARLRHRRHGAHHRQQPDRLHLLRPARRALDALLHRRRQDAGDADLPRQRRRSRGGVPRHRDRARLPHEVPQGRGGGPRVLPAPRAQRAGRADGHAAADVQDHRRSCRRRASSTPTAWRRRA